MSGDPTCWHRWDAADSTDPGPCQCIRDGGHDGPHRCCCGQVDGDDGFVAGSLYWYDKDRDPNA